MKTISFVMQENGKIPEGMKQTFINLFAELAGKHVRLSLGEAKAKRSLDQNAYYWSAIVPHVRRVRFEMGDPLSIEQIHEDLLAQFAPATNSKRMDGEVYSRPMRSKEMSKTQMAEYITAITATMAQFGYPVPIQNAAERVYEEVA